MHRIAVLTEQETRGAQMEEQIARFVRKRDAFPGLSPTEIRKVFLTLC